MDERRRCTLPMHHRMHQLLHTHTHTLPLTVSTRSAWATPYSCPVLLLSPATFSGCCLLPRLLTFLPPAATNISSQSWTMIGGRRTNSRLIPDDSTYVTAMHATKASLDQAPAPLILGRRLEHMEGVNHELLSTREAWVEYIDNRDPLDKRGLVPLHMCDLH